MFVTMGMSLLIRCHQLPAILGLRPLKGHGSVGELRLFRRQEPALDLREDGTIRNGCGRGRATLYKVHPGLHRVWSEGFSLPSNRERPFEGLETFFERDRAGGP